VDMSPHKPTDDTKPTMSARIWAYADRFREAGVHHHRDGKLKRRVFVPLYALRVLIQVGRQWVRDRCPQQAAALAFQTALSLVPIIAIGLAMLRATGGMDESSALSNYIAQQVLPISREEISKHLMDWSSNVGIGTSGVFGVLAVVLLGFLTASTVEKIWNDIWRAERARSIGQRFVVFYALITIVPALMGVSLFHLAQVGLTEGWVGGLGALGATWAGLTFANKLLPVTRVEWRAAAVGGLVSALLFELAKQLFRLYVAEIAFKKYAGIYGTLGLLPIVLLWIYYTWVVVLFGAEVAYALQHLPELELYDRRARRLEHEVLDKVNGLVAARFMVQIVEGWRSGAPYTREALSRKFHVAPEAAERIVRRLYERKLIVELDGDPPTFVPGKPPQEMTLADVMAPFRGADVLTPAVRAASRSAIDTALHKLEDDRTQKLREITVEQLVTAAAAEQAEEKRREAEAQLRSGG
jgi:membrane protein